MFILDEDVLGVHPDTKEMLTPLDLGSLSSLQVTQPTIGMNFKTSCGAIGLCCAAILSINQLSELHLYLILH